MITNKILGILTVVVIKNQLILVIILLFYKYTYLQLSLSLSYLSVSVLFTSFQPSFLIVESFSQNNQCTQL